MTDWVPGDWATILPDDQIRLENADGSVEFKVWRVSSIRNIFIIHSEIAEYHESAWNLFVPVPTQPELPTEPGVYTDRVGDAWRLTSGRWWYGDFKSDDVADFAPFTRLLPEAETAKRIAVELRNRSNGFAGGCHTVAPIGNAAIEKAVEWIMAEFGVSLD